MKRRSRWFAGLAAVALVLITAATAFAANEGALAAAVTVARPNGTLKCGVNVTVTAMVVTATGEAITGKPVEWSFASTMSTSDKIKTSSTTTNASGVARTTVVLACVPGSRQIRAVADAASASAVLSVPAAGAVLGVTSGGPGVTSGGLPNTTTLPGETPAPQDLPAIGTLLAVLAMAAGGGLALRRIFLSRS